MASSTTSVGDYISGFFTLAILIVVVYVGYLAQQGIQNGMAGAKKSMKDAGLTIDENGVSVKTNQRAKTSEEYVQETSQAMLNSSRRLAQSGALSFGSSGSATPEDASSAGKRKGKK